MPKSSTKPSGALCSFCHPSNGPLSRGDHRLFHKHNLDSSIALRKCKFIERAVQARTGVYDLFGWIEEDGSEHEGFRDVVDENIRAGDMVWDISGGQLKVVKAYPLEILDFRKKLKEIKKSS